MLKTKPSQTSLAAILILSSAISAGCGPRPGQTQTPALDRAASGLRPIGQILALRMTRVTTEVVSHDHDVVAAPDSYVAWRIESLLWARLGASAEEVEVSVDAQSASIHGVVPTHWQANDIRDDLARIEVLKGADIRWHVARPDERRPVSVPETTP